MFSSFVSPSTFMPNALCSTGVIFDLPSSLPLSLGRLVYFDASLLLSSCCKHKVLSVDCHVSFYTCMLH